MPNGGDERWQDEKEYRIEPLENDGWKHLTDPPEWVTNSVGEELKAHVGVEYKYRHLHGDTFIYKVTSSVHGR